jgi:signal transduction histidine kinase
MNAIEATGSGGTVVCRLQKTEDRHTRREQWMWSIEDDGPGPRQEIAQSMMEPFVTSKSEGVGLGLSMAKRVAEKLGGGLQWRRSDDKTIFELSIEKR